MGQENWQPGQLPPQFGDRMPPARQQSWGQQQYAPPQPAYGGPWPQQGYPQAPPPVPPQQHRKPGAGKGKLVAGGLVIFAVGIGLGAAIGSSGKTPAAAAAPAAGHHAVASAKVKAKHGKGKHGKTAARPSASARASSPAAAATRTVATFSGSGIKNTPEFTVTSTWKLDYSFSCQSFGYSGNFQVYEDGGKDFSGVSVNDLAMSKAGSTWAYNDSGTHYLAINSECDWKVEVIDES